MTAKDSQALLENGRAMNQSLQIPLLALQALSQSLGIMGQSFF